ATLGGSVVLMTCGQPRGRAVPSGDAVPGPAGAAPALSLIPVRPSLAPNSTIAGVPTLPGGVPTKMPTPIATISAPTAVPDPGPLEKPTPDPRRPEPTYAQPRPEAPLHLTIHGAYSP